MSACEAPEGFDSHREGACTLLARAADLAGLVGQGYADPATWEALLGRARGPGRGGSARAELAGGRRVVLKRMRRGGLTARLWRDRFAGAARLIDNLRVPVEAARRGVATPAPVAMLLRRRALSLYEGWLAVEELAGAEDLLTRLARLPPPDRAELAAAVAAVRRMHDAGVEHRDLNLGNMMLRPAGAGGPEGFVIDLDRAVLRDGPLPASRRRRALARLERSYVKNLGDPGPLAGGPRVWYVLYAAGDVELERTLVAGRGARRLRLALHRAAWRR